MHSEDRKNCKVSDFVQFRTCEIPVLCSLERFFLHISKKSCTFAAENVGKSDKIPSKYIGKTDKTPSKHVGKTDKIKNFVCLKDTLIAC